MGWLTEWRRKRVLEKHSIDDALWDRATQGLPFIPENSRLKALALLFLAEKEFTGAHGLEVTDEMRVAIAAQACLPVLELGLDWYRGWTGIVVYPGDFRVRRSDGQLLVSSFRAAPAPAIDARREAAIGAIAN